MGSRDLTFALLDEPLPADDDLTVLVEQASAAMHRLAIHVHYAACEKFKRRLKPK
jgi:hypothetical protein